MGARPLRVTAGLLWAVLAAGCSSSESPAVTAPSPTATSTSGADTTAVPATDASVRLLAGTPMVGCTVSSAPGVDVTAPALCGTLEVPEDRSDPTGRQIPLRVAVIPAQADVPEPDAFFALAGGPGGASTSFFGWLPGRFADVHARRDIVLVDQRGTGRSNALVLPPMPDTSDLSKQDADAAVQAWADEWLASIDADPRQYTSSVAVDDLDAVREALGYEQVNLYGPSYGGTLAQYYIRQHPDRVRVAIMDGVTPLDVPVFERMAASSEAALELVIERCAADTACDAALPNLSAEWPPLIAALADGVETGLTDPDTGEPVVATLEQVAPGAHVALLDPATASRIPLLVHLAHEGQWAQVVEVLPASTGDGGDWLAMGEIIMCSEAWAVFDPAEVERLGAGSYAMPTQRANAVARAARCAVLPAGVVPDDDAAPVVTELPILWLTADGDPQDPPANLTSIPSQQPNARIAVMPAQQHTVGHMGCAPQVIGEFVEAGTAADLDTSCIEHAEVPGLTFLLP